MASCDAFGVNFSGSAQDFFAHVSDLLHQHGGTISGGPSGGTFSVPMAAQGDFSIAGQTCTIHVTDHPFYISCGGIEDYVRSHV